MGQHTTCAHWCSTGGTRHHLPRTLAQNTEPGTALASNSIIHLRETGWRNTSKDITRAKSGKPTGQATWLHQHMKCMQCAIPAWILIWVSQLQKISWGQWGKLNAGLVLSNTKELLLILLGVIKVLCSFPKRWVCLRHKHGWNNVISGLCYKIHFFLILDSLKNLFFKMYFYWHIVDFQCCF